MGLLAPLSLSLAALSVPILIMYMLKLRRQEQVVSSTMLWQQVLRGTYSAELRPEAPETIQSIYEADPERYDRAARAVLARLGADVRSAGAELEAILPASSKKWARRGWSRLRTIYRLPLL